MNPTITTQFAHDNLLAQVRAAAESSLRTLDDIELGWVGGGDPNPLFDSTVKPPSP